MSFGKTYKGKYTPKNKHKYKGDYTKITYRSSWERATFKWCDERPDIVQWNSEEVVVPYICETDKRQHRYYIDLYIKTKDGQEFLIEVKPKKETVPPKTPKRKTKRYLQECLTYIKNQSKWKAADAYARTYGMRFEVWHEDRLRQLGMKIL